MCANGSRRVFLTAMIWAAATFTTPALGEAGARWTTSVEPPEAEMRDQLTGLAVDNNGNTIVALGKYPGEISYIDGESGQVRWRYRSIGDFIAGVVVDPAGDKIALKDARAALPRATELGEEELVILNRDGDVLLRRAAAGTADLSPSGKYVLTYNTEMDFGLTIYDAASGAVVWHAPREQIGWMGGAAFSSDGRRVLVRTSTRLYMFTAVGDPVWSADFTDGVWDASTSQDGAVTAALVDTRTSERVRVRRLVVIDCTGRETSGMDLLTFRGFGPPDPNQGDWYEVTVTGDGRRIVLAGALPGRVSRLQAVDPTGALIWEQNYESNRVGCKVLSSGIVVAPCEREECTTFRYLDVGTGTEVGSATTDGQLTAWNASPNGCFISVAAASVVTSLGVPSGSAQALGTNGASKSLASSEGSDALAWVSLRYCLDPRKWTLVFRSSRKNEVIAKSRDGKNELRVKVGSRKATVNNTAVILPAAVRLVRSRVQVPSMALSLLAAGTTESERT